MRKLNIKDHKGGLEFILDAIENGANANNERVLFFDGVCHFPFVIRSIENGEKEGDFILSGVADTLKRGRHRAQIEFSTKDGLGRFL
jgi:hypothetical protein